MSALPMNKGVDFARVLSALGQGLMGAGQQGWGAFGPGVMQGATFYDQGVDRERQRELDALTEELRRQQLEDARTANTERAETKRRQQEWLNSLGPGPMAPNNGRPGGMAPQPGPMAGDWSPEELAYFRANPDAAAEIVGAKMFPKAEPIKGMEIAGRLVNPITGEEIADYSAEEIALAQASRPVTNVTTNLPPQEDEFLKTIGKAAGEQAAAITTAANKSRSALDTLNALQKSIGDIQAGGGDTGRMAGVVSEMTALAQSLGIDPTNLGLPPNAGPYEVATSLSNKMALSLIGADAEGGMPANNFSEADRKFIVDIAPNISNTPQGIAAKIEVSRRVNQRNIEAEEMWNSGDYPQTQAGFRQYQKDWAEYVRKNPLFSPEEMQQLRGMRSGAPTNTPGGPDERGTGGGVIRYDSQGNRIQ
jgi:hypothetical protein